MANYQQPEITNMDAYNRRMNKMAALDGTGNQVDPAVSAPPMSTGYPAVPVSTPTMSTGYPPVPVQGIAVGEPNPNGSGLGFPTKSTGYPPVPYSYPPKSTGLPPQLPLDMSAQFPLLNGQQYVATQTDGNGQPMGADQIVQNTMMSMLDPNNPYIARARQRALDMAGDRGLVNSSIAAGNAEGAAIDAAMPLVQQSVGIQQQRENNAFTGLQNQLNRTQGVNNAMLNAELQARQTAYDYNFKNQLQSNSVAQQDWLSNNDFSRQFNAALAMMPISNAFDMSKAIQTYALQDPETYTPEVISGMSNFFQQNLLAMLQEYFPSLYGSGTGG